MYINIDGIGLLTFVIAVSLLLGSRLSNQFSKDGGAKRKFDERQNLVRIRGAAYGLYATWGSLLIVLAAWEFLEQYLGHRMILLICIYFGLFVDAVYTVWNDGYIAVNQYPFFVMVCVALVVLGNLYQAAWYIRKDMLSLDGMMDVVVTWLLSALLFFVVFMILLSKYILKKRQEEE